MKNSHNGRTNYHVGIFVGLFSISAFAQHAALIDDPEATEKGVQEVQVTPARTEGRAKTFFSRKEKEPVEEISEIEFHSTFEMRAKRRVGVGVATAGEFGMVGVQTELNFAVDDSAVIGFGGGPQYSSFVAGWRHVFAGRTLAPFFDLHYARWYGTGSSGTISDTIPQFLVGKMLTDYERNTGIFSVNIMVPGAGLQYNLLNGPYVGTSIYAEAMLLLNFSNFQTVPTGTFGMIYYF